MHVPGLQRIRGSAYARISRSLEGSPEMASQMRRPKTQASVCPCSERTSQHAETCRKKEEYEDETSTEQHSRDEAQ